MAERSVNKAILVGRLGADAETRDTRETGVPFWVNLVSASAPSLPTRIALFTLRSAIEFSSSFEIFDCFFGPGRSATCSFTGAGT